MQYSISDSRHIHYVSETVSSSSNSPWLPLLPFSSQPWESLMEDAMRIWSQSSTQAISRVSLVSAFSQCQAASALIVNTQCRGRGVRCGRVRPNLIFSTLFKVEDSVKHESLYGYIYLARMGLLITRCQYKQDHYCVHYLLTGLGGDNWQGRV